MNTVPYLIFLLIFLKSSFFSHLITEFSYFIAKKIAKKFPKHIQSPFQLDHGLVTNL
jgi:hypothetical protein